MHEKTLSKDKAQIHSSQMEISENAISRKVLLRDYVPTILALGFLVNYALIQFYCVTHANAANDVVSARFQDVLIMIISYYFRGSHNKKS